METDTVPKQRRRSNDYPPPLVIPPKSKHHAQTFIILHGRGDNAENFAPSFLLHLIPTYISLQKAFPDAKFVFPTASYRRAAWFNRVPLTQWFDASEYKRSPAQEEIQIEGLRESCTYLHGLISEAIAEIGASNVVVGGLSQGCSTVLSSMLLWKGESLAAWFGMCGWLPFEKRMTEAVEEATKERDGDDVFDRSDDDKPTTVLKPAQIASDWLKHQLDFQEFPSSSHDLQETPVFLGHGVDDDKVPTSLGRDAAQLLIELGISTTWKEYEDLGHWYSAPMLFDIVNFLNERLQHRQREHEGSKSKKLETE